MGKGRKERNMPFGEVVLSSENGGLGKIPDTYFRTIGAEDMTRFHREISPADRLGGGCNNSRSFWPTCGYYG